MCDDSIADYYAIDQIGDEFKTKVRVPFLHECKDGKIVDVRGISEKYPRMDDNHLLNTIRFIKRRCKEGVMVGSGTSPEDFDFDCLVGREAKEYLQYKKYKKEAKRRGLL